MKKFLSLMLAGLMSASLFVVGAAAETTKPGVVGETDGVVDFTPVENKDNNINVKVETVTHKYAVDLVFSFDDFTLGGLEWNVQTMRYDFVGGNTNKDGARTIKVNNRSDQPVYAYAEVSSAGTGIDKAPDLSIAMSGENGISEAKKLEVLKATAGSGSDNGKASDGTLTVSISSTKWADVANYYGKKVADKPEVTTFKVATVTVYISKD